MTRRRDEHPALTVKFSNLQHDVACMARVAFGKGAGILLNFNSRGEVAFACLIAGCYGPAWSASSR
jgi:uncharacterized cupredoxin-like copper-binding protein